MKVRTRFAPSPTGHVHIGNIRVAIYNWLFARHFEGDFLLRIEDTDRKRSTPEAVATLLDSLKWLELYFDEEPLYQSSREQDHLEAAEMLLNKGLAYKEDKGGAGKGECIIFKMPNQDMTFFDEVKGVLTKAAGDMADFVIVRSNGSPTFHLANVMDDGLMGVTHVIRGDDHIENTFRHVALYEALDIPIPAYAHLPMIVNAQGKPYSKRDGDAYVGDFRRAGYLPEAMLNYLALLGWSPGDDREIMDRDEMIDLFDLSRVRSSASQFDTQKLRWMNGEYMRRIPFDYYEDACRNRLIVDGIWDDTIDDAYFHAVLELMGERIHVWSDITKQAAFFFKDDYAYDEKAVKKRLKKDGAMQRLRDLKERFAGVTPFKADGLETALTELAAELEIKTGQLIHPVRVAVSGMAIGPGLYDMLELLGRERVLKRIERTIVLLQCVTEL